MRRFSLLSGVFITLALCQYIQAYSASGQKKWALSNLPVHYEINQNGSDNCNGEEFDAVRRGFESWTEISTCSLNFHDDGLTPYMPSLDGFNTVAWVESGWSSTYGFPDAICVTGRDWDISGVDTILQECDQFFNGEDYSWSVTGPYGYKTYDVENTTAHEAGHWMGMEHSSNPEATMYGSALEGETKKRDLHSDDIAGASFLYPYQSHVAGWLDKI